MKFSKEKFHRNFALASPIEVCLYTTDQVYMSSLAGSPPKMYTKSDLKMAQFLLTTILCASFASLKFCTGVDTLFPNQKIAVGQTLISSNQVFEMGFFSPGKSPNRFLGIWYKSIPETVVWVANRNNPITESSLGGVTFGISGNGRSIAISRDGSIIWSANSTSGVASNPVLQLLDVGNLVLVDETTKGYLWQSFDYPTDNMLPGMRLASDIDAGGEKYLTSWKSPDDPSPGDFVFKIENHGLPEMVMYRRSIKAYRTGKWNGVYFSGVLPLPTPVFGLKTVFSEEKLLSVALPDATSFFFRATLNTSGLFHSTRLNAGKSKWILTLTRPRDTCDEYGLCGPNGICRIDKLDRCECIKGFAPTSIKDWDERDWSSGCTRITPLNCNNGDGFVEIKSVKYPDMLTFWLNTSMSLDECKVECLKNCNCTAYANTYVTNGGSGCVMWFGDLIDFREFSGVDSKQNIYFRLPVSELSDYSDTDLENEEEKKKKKKKSPRLILISIASGVLVSSFINGSLFMISRRKRRATESSTEDIELPLFKFSTIVAATDNFSREQMIGEGGFGPVYKGQLSSGKEIAIKRLSRSSGQGLEEFKNEVTLMAKLQHTNLVRLLGCCIESEERILIYEYLHNRSLDYFVFDQNQKALLMWPKRFQIIMGIVKGLLYLHHDSRLKIIHRDLKTSNILLDKNLTPKISDFGLARIFEEDQPISRTRTVVGTYGYMSPEYAIEGKFSVKSDIFSMGVMLLEIVSGKKNKGLECSHGHCHSLLEHAWLLWKENKILELMDECLVDTFVESEVKRCIHVGLLCIQSSAEDRPMMSSVLFMLGTDGAILPEPKEPGFFIGKSSIPERSHKSRSPISEGNRITMTDLEAR